VHLAGAIDIDAEKKRITRDIEKTTKERSGVVNRLTNPSFKERAPAEVVEKTERDLALLDERLARLTGSLDRLQAL
jgi:valyl-tRNA synthetase